MNYFIVSMKILVNIFFSFRYDEKLNFTTNLQDNSQQTSIQ